MSDPESTREEREARQLAQEIAESCPFPELGRYRGGTYEPQQPGAMSRAFNDLVARLTPIIVRALAARRGGDAASSVTSKPCPTESDAAPVGTRLAGAQLKWRKRPIEVEACPWTGDNYDALVAWGAPVTILPASNRPGKGVSLIIGTLEDGPNCEAVHVADEGDWIIRGIKGEFYPCKPDIFAATYEPANAVNSSSPTLAAVEAALRAVPWKCEHCGHEISVPNGTYLDSEPVCSGSTFKGDAHYSKPDYPAMARAVLALWAQEAKG